MVKNTAINAIAKIYDPLYKFPYDHYEESGSYAEQREQKVSSIIEEMNKKLENINKK